MKKVIGVFAMFLLVMASGVTEASVTLGPDIVPDSPSGPPYVFTNASGGYGYELKISPNPNPLWVWHVPKFTLTNTSTNAWADILSFEFTIGDTRYTFDHLGKGGTVDDHLPVFTIDLNSDGSYFNSTPDFMDNHLRSDEIYFDFTGFNKGDVFTFVSDVDGDSINTIEDFRHIFWNNDFEGRIPNSEITVEFSSSVIPAPGAVILCAIGVGLVGLLRRREVL